jgi:hypothetical protein
LPSTFTVAFVTLMAPGSVSRRKSTRAYFSWSPVTKDGTMRAKRSAKGTLRSAAGRGIVPT